MEQATNATDEIITDAEREPPKLYQMWGWVLARGALEGALVVIVLIPGIQSRADLAVFAGLVIGGGAVLELAVAYRLPGHPFRSILIFTGLSGLVIGVFLIVRAFTGDVTLSLLVVTTGLWVALRGFASLWLGLSIVTGTFERVVPAGAGILGLAVGGAAMLWFEPATRDPFILLLSLYGLGSMLLQVAVALRMRVEQHRRRAQQE